MANLLLLHGPNLNLLGTREPAVYGHKTLAQLDAELRQRAKDAGHILKTAQANSEHVLIEHIHCAQHDATRCILINPAAFTHTSVALRDALLAVAVPFIEIHISNPKSREKFRHQSFLEDIAMGVVAGFGTHSYHIALEGALAFVHSRPEVQTI